MKTVSNINTLLSAYLSTSPQSGATTTIGALNACMPVLYSWGDWRALKTRYEVNVQSGYFSLPPDYESVLSASLWDVPIDINNIEYQTRRGGVGTVDAWRPVSGGFGILDLGYVPLMSEIADTGCDEFIFTSVAAFASGDFALVTYTDTDAGYSQVNLPLHTFSTTISGAATASAGAETTLAVTSSATFVVGLGVTCSNMSTGNENYEDTTWRVSAIPDATHITINKSYDGDATITGTLTSAATLVPESTIIAVESIVYTSLPAKTLVKDADGILYAILCAGDGVGQYRRYSCPQVPSDPNNPDDWNVIAVVKRAWIPVTSNSDLVYLDSIPVLTYAFLAIVQRDAGNTEAEMALWEQARAELDRELHDNNGGDLQYPSIDLWGVGQPGLSGCNGYFR